jgi:predicted NAD-dependent protein-ADP-ribosyltransferase YbiA (DUF1768 family)
VTSTQASPEDRIWGVGYDLENAEANRSDWGLNLLGKAISKVRQQLQSENKHL